MPEPSAISNATLQGRTPSRYTRPVERIAVIALLAACGGKRDDANGWADRPLAQVTGRLGGTLSYTIMMPQGMRNPDKESPSRVIYEALSDPTVPSIDLYFDPAPPKTLEAAFKRVDPEFTDEVVRKEALADGFIVVLRQRETHWAIHVDKPAGNVGIHCLGMQARHHGEPEDASRALLETICQSLVVTAR
jgi:hypothetical protein